MKKPTLVYDGNCDFCLYCTEYFKKITDENIQFSSYHQDSLGLDKKDCQQSIYLIVNSDEIYHGAAAAFKALSYGLNDWGWWLYQNLPGFKFLTESVYKWITKHRSFVFKIAKIICGNPWQVGRITFLSWGFIFFTLIIGLTLKTF